MSKEIDFSKAPEGATHYYQESEDDHFAWAKYVDGEIYISVPHYQKYWELYTDSHGEHPIKIPQQWSIYTNDKPLSELTDEQAEALFRWRMSGGLIECYLGSGMAFFDKNSIYRAKKKSDRELFIEEAMRSVDLRGGDGEKDIYGKLFDSGKFKLVEQPK